MKGINLGMDGIMVSIVCLTYNHEAYIQEALESFMAQKTNFKYEIIIHDDASTDNTTEIIKEYEKKYPGIIYVIYEKTNQYSINKNFMFMRSVYSLCRGKYIAFCEGDDFWIDVYKLQIQVEFLEKSPEYCLSVHNAVILNCQDSTMKTMNPFLCENDIPDKEIIMLCNGMIPTASMVMRADILKIDDWMLEYEVGDWPLQLYSMVKGKVYYFL